MDEYNSGMDPEVKRYFRKIINSFSAGLLWLVVIATAGIFFRLGEMGHGIHWYNIVFLYPARGKPVLPVALLLQAMEKRVISNE